MYDIPNGKFKYPLVYASGGWCPTYKQIPDTGPDKDGRISIPIDHPDWIRLVRLGKDYKLFNEIKWQIRK